MWGKLILAALGAGVAVGAIGASKVSGVTSKVVNRVSPKKNRVAILEVELDDNQDISDLAFLVVKGVAKGSSKDIVEVINVSAQERK